MFKGEKTALVYFTRNSRLQSTILLDIKGAEVRSQEEIKILEIIMDLGLRFKNYVQKILVKGLKVVFTLK